MARTEINTDELKIEQKPPIFDRSTYDGDIVMADRDLIDHDYAAELAFMEEPVTIRLAPSSQQNASNVFPVWVNGKGAEVFQNGRWDEIIYLPVGRELVIKRKALEVIIRAKIDTIRHDAPPLGSEYLDNRVLRSTAAVHSVSVIHDPSPKGAAWLTDMLRRNF